MTAPETTGNAAASRTGPARRVSAPAPERWLPVVGFEGWYSVSDRGRVRSEDRVVTLSDGVARCIRGQLLAPFPQSGKEGRRYLCVHLVRAGVRETRAVHLLVLESHVGPRPDGMLGCHWDDDITNNRLSNLRYDDHIGNAADRVRNTRLRRALDVIQTW